MRKALALFFVVVVVTPFLVATLIVLPVRAWLFNREFYYDALSGEQVIKLLEGTSLPIPADISLPISPEILEAFFISLAKIITPEYLDSQLQPLIDSGLDVLEGKADAINISIDLVPLKEAIQGENREDFINTFAVNFPVCESGEAPNLTQLLVVCRPVDIPAETFAQNLIEPILPQMIQFLPDSYPIQLPVTLPTQKIFFWTSLFPNLSLSGFLTVVVIVITTFALLCWLLAALIADASWHVRLKWLGGSLIFPALVVLLIAGVIFLFTFNNILTWALNLVGMKIAVEAATGLFSLISHLAKRIALAFLISDGIALGCAIALIAWGNIITPRQTESTELENN